VQWLWPSTGETIDEDQYFILQLNGPATLASVQAHVWCAAQDLGERVAVRLIDGKERTALLKSQQQDKPAAKNPSSFVTLACQRRLTAATKVQLVYGRGVATPGSASRPAGMAFTASLSCERENAQAACLPIRPLRLSFSAPVARKLLEKIALGDGQQSFSPSFDADHSDGDALLSQISFKGYFAEQASLRLTLPANFQDASGRALHNAASFPMTVRTGAMPPLAKFAAAPFGIIERFAEPDGVAMLPVTLRHVQADLQLRALTPARRGAPAGPLPAGQVSSLQLQTDADIIAWFRKIQRYDSLPPVLADEDKSWVQARMLSLLQGQAGVKTLDLPLPAAADPRPFEVVGIPLTAGFHVLEISSQRLGSSLLDPRHGRRPMFVFQAGARERAGLGHHAGQGFAGGGCAGAGVGLPGPRAGWRQHQRTRHCQPGGLKPARAGVPGRRKLQRCLLCQCPYRVGRRGRRGRHGLYLERLEPGH